MLRRCRCCLSLGMSEEQWLRGIDLGGKGLAQISKALFLETFHPNLAGSLWVSPVAIKRTNSSAGLPLSLSLSCVLSGGEARRRRQHGIMLPNFPTMIPKAKRNAWRLGKGLFRPVFSFASKTKSCSPGHISLARCRVSLSFAQAQPMAQLQLDNANAGLAAVMHRERVASKWAAFRAAVQVVILPLSARPLLLRQHTWHTLGEQFSYRFSSFLVFCLASH
ncbi:hypothetical protein HDV62DRAFT_295163 [Trichoderma sp. SZMC 28011]